MENPAESMGISLSKLRSFIAIAEENQFNRAAKRLGVSQPLLSSQIRDLEQLLGVSLFNRTTRSVVLTAEGTLFLRLARQLLHDLGTAIGEMRNRSQLKQGRIVIAATPSVSSTLLPRAILAFNERFPDIRIQVHEEILSGIEGRVAEGVVDIGLGPCPSRQANLDFSPLLSEKLFGVVAETHPLSKFKRVKLARLAAYPLLSSTPGAGIRQVLDHALQDQGVFPSVAHVLSNPDTILAMAEAGLGVAYLPALVALPGYRRRLHLLDVVEPESSRTLGFIQCRGGNSSSAVAEFVRLCSTGELFRHVLEDDGHAGDFRRRVLKGIKPLPR